MFMLVFNKIIFTTLQKSYIIMGFLILLAIRLQCYVKC